MTLYELIIVSAEKALGMQLPDGSMPAGHNGLYHHPETPVRNTAHWLVTFAWAFRITGQEKYRNGVEKCFNYLNSNYARPDGFTFHFRTYPNRTYCNGVIGQAWAFEALVAASEVLQADEPIDLAIKIYNMHNFNTKTALWNVTEIDGTIYPIDATFNHQLWFASCASLIGDTKEDILLFMDNIPKNLEIRDNGRIIHRIPYNRVYTGAVGFLRRTKLKLREKLNPEVEKQREIGYHHFNLYGFAMLWNAIGEHKFFSCEMFQKIVSYIDTEEFKQGIEDNKYGYPYNPPGFECGYAIKMFPEFFANREALYKGWINSQIDKCFDFDSGMMSKNASDENTCAARIYEATRLDDVELDI